MWLARRSCGGRGEEHGIGDVQCRMSMSDVGPCNMFMGMSCHVSGGNVMHCGLSEEGNWKQTPVSRVDGHFFAA